MQTDCFGTRVFGPDNTKALFLQGRYALLKLMIPGAVCLLLWMLRASNHRITHQTLYTLRLHETPTDDQVADPVKTYACDLICLDL